MKTINIAEYDDEKQRMTFEEAKKACKAKGGHLPDANEAFQIKTESKYESFWVELPGGLLARYFSGYGYIRRGVDACDQPSVRYGVVCVLDEKPHKHVWKTKKVCGCGAERR